MTKRLFSLGIAAGLVAGAVSFSAVGALQSAGNAWMDGRIDDPNAGWKGRGIWTTVSTRTPFHMEGGKGMTSKVTKFQLRPDSVAR